jgi:hypothetical protein
MTYETSSNYFKKEIIHMHPLFKLMTDPKYIAYISYSKLIIDNPMIFYTTIISYLTFRYSKMDITPSELNDTIDYIQKIISYITKSKEALSISSEITNKSNFIIISEMPTIENFNIIHKDKKFQIDHIDEHGNKITENKATEHQILINYSDILHYAIRHIQKKDTSKISEAELILMKHVNKFKYNLQEISEIKNIFLKNLMEILNKNNINPETLNEFYVKYDDLMATCDIGSAFIAKEIQMEKQYPVLMKLQKYEAIKKPSKSFPDLTSTYIQDIGDYIMHKYEVTLSELKEPQLYSFIYYKEIKKCLYIDLINEKDKFNSICADIYGIIISFNNGMLNNILYQYMPEYKTERIKNITQFIYKTSNAHIINPTKIEHRDQINIYNNIKQSTDILTTDAFLLCTYTNLIYFFTTLEERVMMHPNKPF